MNDETIGRPRVFTGLEEAMQTVTYRMPLWHVRKARRKGNGNASEGMRLFVEEGEEPPNAAESLTRPVRRDSL